MKKILCAALLSAALLLPIIAQAQVAVAPVPPPPPTCGVPGLPMCPVGSIWMPAVALAFAGWVIYADANGIPFPLCNRFGLKCYDDYPD